MTNTNVWDCKILDSEVNVVSDNWFDPVDVTMPGYFNYLFDKTGASDAAKSI